MVAIPTFSGTRAYSGRTYIIIILVDFSMTTQPIPAHYDGHHVCLDMDVDLEPNAKLWVTVVQDDPVSKQEREEWNTLSLQAFAAITENEPDEYTSDMIKVRNPEFREIR
jgi:hypothetical protein